MESKTILCVDDVADVREMFKTYLEEKHYQVITLPNPRSAIEVLEANKIDLIFCDLNMPYENGFEFLERIKETKFKDIPFIIVTNILNESYVDKSKQMGAQEDIHKFRLNKEMILSLAEKYAAN